MYDTVILKHSTSIIKEYMSRMSDEMNESGNLFTLSKNEYDDKGNVIYDFMDIIEEGMLLGFEYVNTIVVPTSFVGNAIINDNVLYIVWLAKNKKKQYFDKDAIRESHIWKDVEWGKRDKNYNPKGKDPGNVWIPTIDNGKGMITEHILLDIPQIVERLIKSTRQDSKVYILTDNEYQELNNDFTEITILPVPSKEKVNLRINRVRDSFKGEYFNEKNKVIFGTSENLDLIGNDLFKVVITSPPYWDLKDYFKEGQIGQESYDEYLCRMNTVWSQVYKKMALNGTFWLNINIRVKNGRPILLPKDFIRQCKLIGFYFKGILIWHKSSGIPTHNKNIVDRHEYVLIFSKSENLEINRSCFEKYADYKNSQINGGVFWNINRKAGSVGKKYIHPAIYPNDLVTRILDCSSNKGDLVLDPFLGSGTTLISVINSDRIGVGYEYNEGFKELMISRFNLEVDDWENKIEFINNKTDVSV